VELAIAADPVLAGRVRVVRRSWLALLLLFVPLTAGADDWNRWLQADLDQEKQLLTEDLSRHRDLREREQREAAKVNEAADRVDRALAAKQPADVTELHGLESALAASRASLGTVVAEETDLRARIYERLRRVQWLGDLLVQAREGSTPAADRVSGTWLVTMLPSGQTGRFDLRLDGTLVAGSYHLDQGSFGSLRGTLVGDVLSLERIDSLRGSDVVFEGQVDAEGVQVRGWWRSSLLSSGGPPAGSWVGRRVKSNTGDEIDSR
jgi:hypothetical protein